MSASTGRIHTPGSTSSRTFSPRSLYHWRTAGISLAPSDPYSSISSDSCRSASGSQLSVWSGYETGSHGSRSAARRFSRSANASRRNPWASTSRAATVSLPLRFLPDRPMMIVLLTSGFLSRRVVPAASGNHFLRVLADRYVADQPGAVRCRLALPVQDDRLGECVDRLDLGVPVDKDVEQRHRVHAQVVRAARFGDPPLDHGPRLLGNCRGGLHDAGLTSTTTCRSLCAPMCSTASSTTPAWSTVSGADSQRPQAMTTRGDRRSASRPIRSYSSRPFTWPARWIRPTLGTRPTTG